MCYDSVGVKGQATDLPINAEVIYIYLQYFLPWGAGMIKAPTTVRGGL